MRTTAMTSRTSTVAGLPRGWTIVGLALESWLVLAGAWVGISQLFGFVASAL